MFEIIQTFVVMYVFAGLIVWVVSYLLLTVVLGRLKVWFPEEDYSNEDDAAAMFKEDLLWTLGYTFMAWPAVLYTTITGRVIWSDKDDT